MAPTTASPLREDLLRRAAHVIADEGSSGLTLRRLADDVGTSTMAVYTHFGGMDGLRRAVREEGFGRLAARLAQVPAGGGALHHLAGLCMAYYEHGTEEADLYRVMFLEDQLDEDDVEACAGTFETLIAGVQRCVEEGELASGDPPTLAAELWGLGHGLVAMRLSGLMAPEAVDALTREAVTHLLIGFGADPDAARTHLTAA